MENNYNLSVETLQEKLAYDAETGIFWWKVAASRNVQAGSEAGCIKATRTDKTGKKISYRYIRFDGASIPAAKLAWAIHYSEWPSSRIHFVDGDALNLRISNLQETNSINAQSIIKSSFDQKTYMKEHRKMYPVEWKDTYLRKSYGINMNSYIEMAVAQENKCAICNEEEVEVRAGKSKSLSVDHNHTTGKVRGLLCSACNKAIGLLKDDRKVLLSAIQYLDKHSETNVVSLAHERTV